MFWEYSPEKYVNIFSIIQIKKCSEDPVQTALYLSDGNSIVITGSPFYVHSNIEQAFKLWNYHTQKI